mgnify:FL=1
MGSDIKGYSVVEIIRLNIGSPATNFLFTKMQNVGSICDSMMITNLGSNNVFASFSGAALVTGGSTAMLLPPNAIRSLDIRASGISIVSSGGNVTTEVEVIGLGV